MEVIVIESQAYQSLLTEIKAEIQTQFKELKKTKAGTEKLKWVDRHEAMRILGLKSKSTMQRMRDRGVIEFSQPPHGRPIMYDRKSLERYMESNRVTW